MPIQITGKIYGEKQVADALHYAPKQFYFAIHTWLRGEHNRFLGKKGTSTGYRGILSGRRRAGGWPGTWSRSIVNLFKGYIDDFGQKENATLKLRMGVGLGHPRKIHEFIERINEGGTFTSSGRMMTVPNYKNLAATGERSNRGGRPFYKMMQRQNRLVMIKKGGVVYFFDKNQEGRRGSFPRSSLLFTGRYNIRVRPQFVGRYDFVGRFSRMEPAMIERAAGAVDRVTAKVENMMATGKMGA